jgi:hypothetical protein
MRSLVPAAVMAILAFALVLTITDPPGPGLDPDALAYLGAAESVASRLEYRIPTAPWSSADSTAPLAHFPPGYSTVLAIPVRLGMAPAQGARLVQALAAFGTVGIVVFLVAEVTSPVAGVLLALALFATAAMHEVHVSVLSEPLFLACVALTLAAIARAPDRPLRAGLAAAAGALTRYAGVALVGAAVLAPLRRRAPWPTRLRRAGLALLPALLLQGVWVAHTRHALGPSAIRHFALYGNLDATLRQGGATLRDWLVPDAGGPDDRIPHRGPLAVATALLLAIFVAVAVRRARSGDARDSAAWRLLAACGLLIACYAATLIASRVAADPAIPFDQRILAPLVLLGTTLCATAIALWWRTSRSVVVRALVGAALLAWWVASGAVTRAATRYVAEHGSDLAGDTWRRSELLDWARRQGAGHPLYTNWPGPVYFYLHRPSRGLPASGDARALAALVDTLRVRDGRVLAFSVPSVDFVTVPMLLAQRDLCVVATLSDGVVLAAGAPDSVLPCREPIARPASIQHIPSSRH